MTAIRDLARQADSLRQSLSGLSRQLDSQSKREEISDLAQNYFAEISGHIADGEQRLNADQAGHYLLELRHKRGTTAKASNELKRLRDALRAVDLQKVKSAGVPTNRTSSIDVLIVQTLDKMVPSAALSYRQALADIQESHRLSWRGTATELREALRETLDHLAPDLEVLAQPGFKLEGEMKGPSMKQKVRYVLSARGVSKTASAVPEDASSAVEAAFASLVRSLYTRGSMSTHVNTSRSEVERVLMWVRAVFQELLELKG
jgi:hypothetical protein